MFEFVSIYTLRGLEHTCPRSKKDRDCRHLNHRKDLHRVLLNLCFCKGWRHPPPPGGWGWGAGKRTDKVSATITGGNGSPNLAA